MLAEGVVVAVHEGVPVREHLDELVFDDRPIGLKSAESGGKR